LDAQTTTDKGALCLGVQGPFGHQISVRRKFENKELVYTVSWEGSGYSFQTSQEEMALGIALGMQYGAFRITEWLEAGGLYDEEVSPVDS